MGVLAH
jgi:hypothetical protein